jgi:hypothetical protein
MVALAVIGVAMVVAAGARQAAAADSKAEKTRKRVRIDTVLQEFRVMTVR